MGPQSHLPHQLSPHCHTHAFSAAVWAGQFLLSSLNFPQSPGSPGWQSSYAPPVVSGPCNPISSVWRVLSLSYSVTREMGTIPIRLWKTTSSRAPTFLLRDFLGGVMRAETVLAWLLPPTLQVTSTSEASSWSRTFLPEFLHQLHHQHLPGYQRSWLLG